MLEGCQSVCRPTISTNRPSSRQHDAASPHRCLLALSERCQSIAPRPQRAAIGPEQS